ncbi:TRAP transporter small permease subunit [Chromohalobacter israelensis]|uniref:TRAP transporter small permease protein n=1 Tax=Chromohalobacter israelensis (strain ATCC BAA-138 / DSM 3043 / CIP 106854 / NCIMB 13768 / 1H11) TaxID=290398 RepID=Q1QUM7_CHRI1|nr:TRAP transporter small permease [Chromohalobacter salexigens]ABE59831.1 TRAP-type mannitol/chloroaromatic compound transport system small permease component-like protein [Chromohalobacter salexigens DSM 3043]MDO0947221.1 TRAP transporter small permease [Chromohalobacter salexigens]
MRLLSRLAAGMDRISAFIGYACAVLFFACIILSALEVVMRYVFNSPTQWTFETVMALCATGWVMTSGYVTQRKRHIAITMMELVVPAHVWKKMELVSLGVAIFALAMLIWATWEPAMMALHGSERSGSSFNPLLPAYLKPTLVVGAFLYLLQLLANVVHWFEDQAKGEAE